MSRLVPWFTIALLTLFATLLVGVSFFKLQYGLYNALDLGIFNQVFWQTTHGHFFGMTIHPHSYLGDHFNLFILLLAPFYAVVPQPETLLVLQALAIASAPLPLLLLRASETRRSILTRVLVILGVFLWIINPYLHNAFFFEFHTLLFAAPLLTSTYWAYRTNRWKSYATLLLILLTLREDVSLTVGAFCLFAFLERKSWKWWAPGLALSAIWFLAATEISSRLNTSGQYKFIDLYSWMKLEVKSLQALTAHIFSPMALRTLGLIFSSFLWLPALTPRVLLLALPSVLVMALTNRGIDTPFLVTHYQIIFLTVLLIAFFDAIPKIVETLERLPRVRPRITKAAFGLILGLLVTIVGIQSSISSPFFVQAHSETNLYRLPQRVPEVREAFAEILKDTDRLLVGSSALADFGDRAMLMSLHYAYIGKKQFSKEDFPLPSIDAAYFDSEEIIRLFVIKDRFDWAKEGIEEGSERLQTYLEREGLKPVKTFDDTILFTKTGTQEPFRIRNEAVGETTIGEAALSTCEPHVCLTLETRHPAQSEDVLIRLTMKTGEGETMWQSFYLPAYGLVMPHAIESSRVISTDWTLALPTLQEGTYEIHATLEPIEGEHAITGLRHAAFIPKKEPSIRDDRYLGHVIVARDGSVSVDDEDLEETSRP